MSITRRIFVLALGLVVLGAAPVRAAETAPDLRDQLALATEAGDSLAAIELLRRLDEEGSATDADQEKLTELWLAVGDYAMAESVLADWPEAPAGLAARVQAEILWRRDDNPAEAIKVLDTYLAAEPGDADALADLARYLAAAGEWDRQIDVLNRLIDANPTAGLLLDRAAAQRNAGDFAAAVRDARAAQALAPSDEAVIAAVPAYDRLDTALDAIATLDAELKDDPKNVYALLVRAHFWQTAGIYSRALQDAEAALALAPDAGYARLTKGRSLYQLDRIDADLARSEYLINPSAGVEATESALGIIDNDVALIADPNDATLLGYRASWFNYIGQPALALADADAALAIDPAQPDAALAGMYAQSQLGGVNEVIARFRAFEATNPPKAALSEAADLVVQPLFRESQFASVLDFADIGLAARESESLLRTKAQALNRLGRQTEAAEFEARANALSQNR